MKTWTRCALALGLLLGACSSAPTKEVPVIPMGDFFPYTLLYQSGRQGTYVPSTSPTTPYGGLDREANALEAIRTNNTNLLYIDGGNLFVPEGATDIKKFADQAPVIVEALNVMSLDVFAPGPSDFALGKETLQKLSKQAAFRFVATNVMDENERRIFPAFQLVQRGKLTFAFLSVLPEGWYGKSIHATSVKSALNKWIWQASIRADFVIVLSQQADIEEDRKILDKYPQVKLVLGNDPRRSLDTPEWVRGRLLLDGYRHGMFLGKLTFEYRAPFFGFYSEPELARVQALRLEKERELASIDDTSQRSAMQGVIATLKQGHPEKRPAGASRFLHELIPLDRTRFGKPNEVSTLLSPNAPQIIPEGPLGLPAGTEVSGEDEAGL